MNSQKMPLAVRVHTKLIKNQRRRHAKQERTDDHLESTQGNAPNNQGAFLPWWKNWPKLVLVIDTETTTNTVQKLLYGDARVYSDGKLMDEILFYADDLPEDQLEILKQYAQNRREGDIEGQKGRPALPLLSCWEFIQQVLIPIGYRVGGVVVGFNILFDLSRLADHFEMPANGHYADGFTLSFKSYTDDDAKRQADLFSPQIGTKSINTKAAFKGFLNPKKNNGERHGSGYLMDLRTFAYVLTSKSHSLKSACEEFGVEHGKIEAGELGIISPENIDYCRRDVLATWELYGCLIQEYCHHPIAVPPHRLYSPASLGKGYLEAMNIRTPQLEVDPSLGFDANFIYGIALQCYYGGWVECLVRKIHVPVIYLDFLSMYPTVISLMGLWRYQIAARIAVQEATAEVREFVDKFVRDDLLKPETWQQLTVLVCIRPNGDFLPARSWFNLNHTSIAWAHLTADPDSTGEVWYTLADVLASKIKTGRTPHILQAIRFSPLEMQEGLCKVNFYNSVWVDPYKDDFYKMLIEQRKLKKNDTNLSKVERKRADGAFKGVANSTDYGVHVQLNRVRIGINDKVQVYSGTEFTSTSQWFEEPGSYYDPVLGALITCAAHLMLMLVQHKIEQRGGIIAFKDTDSAAIVAAEQSGTIVYIDDYGKEHTITVLSKAEVQAVLDEFASINPYDEKIIPGSILKVEAENKPLEEDEKALALNAKTGEFFFVTVQDYPEPLQLYCYAISSKKYCLYNRVGDIYILRKASEHVLGAYMPPFEGEADNAWIERFWLDLVSGYLRDNSDLAKIPALIRLSINTQHLMSAIQSEGEDEVQGYADNIKPYNFLVCPVPYPGFNGKEPPALVAPFMSPQEALNAKFYDKRHPGEQYSIKVWDGDPNLEPGTVLMQSLKDALERYPYTPETKLVDCCGEPCSRATVGVLSNPTIEFDEGKYVGKEVNFPEERQAGMLDAPERLTVYHPGKWISEIRPKLQKIPTKEIVAATGLSRSEVTYLKNGKRSPRPETLSILEKLFYK